MIIVFTWTIDCKLRPKSGGLCIHFSDVSVVELSHQCLTALFLFLKFPAGFSGKDNYSVWSTEHGVDDEIAKWFKKKKHLRVPKDASLIWAVLEREKRSAPLRPRLKDLEELPHNIHHFVICPTPPVSSRGLLAQWTCITYRLPVIHFYNLTPFPGCVHPARSGAILRPRYTFLKKSQSKSHICFFWTTERHANVYRYELGLNQANHISTSKNHKHLGIHTFPSHIPPLSPTSTMHPKISTLQTPHLPTLLAFVESDGVLPVRCQVVSTNTAWLQKKKGGLRFD